MNTKYELPMMMSAKDLQSMGFSRSMAYRLLQGDLMPVVCIGKRRFIRHETLLKWLAEQEKKCPAGSPPDYVRAETHSIAEDIPDDNKLSFADYHDGYTTDAKNII